MPPTIIHLAMNKTPIIVAVLLGPTGSGKTGLLTRLSSPRFEVVSCDSRQVYREMEIGTAAPGPEILKIIPHHLTGILTPDRRYSAALFAEEAARAIREIDRRGRIPILAGGTGFYYRALRTGVFQVDVSAEIRSRVQGLTLTEKRDALLKTDPDIFTPIGQGERAAGRIHPNDEYRITRALEVVLAGGLSWREQWRRSERKSGGPSEFEFRGWILTPDPTEHEQKLHRRATEMVDEGFLAETETVLKRYGSECPGLRTLGYRFAVDVIQGRLPESELAESLFTAHRQYARRQRTWFRREDALQPLDGEGVLEALNGWSESRF